MRKTQLVRRINFLLVRVLPPLLLCSLITLGSRTVIRTAARHLEQVAAATGVQDRPVLPPKPSRLGDYS